MCREIGRVAVARLVKESDRNQGAGIRGGEW